MLAQIAKQLITAAPLAQQAPLLATRTYSTVFEKLGGKENVKAAVDKFYEKIVRDPVTAPFFANVDMKKQRAKQTAFLTFALGGPNEYKGRSMYEAHKGMKLSNKEFDAVAGHLVSTLRDLGVAEAVIAEAVTVVESTRPQVLGQAQ